MVADATPAVFPRGVRILAILLVLATVILLTLGALTTSFRAGMADPVWPTEPWFLIVNGHKYSLEPDRNFLLEHTHRAAGFTVGILASLLAIGVWWVGADRRPRWFGLVAIVALLVAYGGFHRQMGEAWKARVDRQKALDAGLEALPMPDIFPLTDGLATAGCALALLAVCALHVMSNQPGRWVRALTGVVLISVMIQGLLGGYRVYLDQLFGPLLSQIHGTFAQVVFAAMCCLPILMAKPKPERFLLEFDRARFGGLALALPIVVFVQLVWGVMVRHTASPLAQRLHLLTAFVVVGLAVWLTVRVRATPTARRVLGFSTLHLIVMLAVQVMLGVEAWIGKFAAFGKQWNVLPTARDITPMLASIRSLHVLIGTAVLASAVVVALRTWRRMPSNFAYSSSTDD